MMAPNTLTRRQERRILARFPVSPSQARVLARLAFGEGCK